jgi:hypothetical protein
MFAFGLAQALPAAANAGSADGAGASTSGSSSAVGDNSTTSTPKMNRASTSSAPQSASKSTERREGLGDNKSGQQERLRKDGMRREQLMRWCCREELGSAFRRTWSELGTPAVHGNAVGGDVLRRFL